MLVHSIKRATSFRGEDGEQITLRVRPYQPGSAIEVTEVAMDCDQYHFSGALQSHEVDQLREFLSQTDREATSGSLAFEGENGERVVFRRDNRGEPFREGVSVRVEGFDEFPDYMGPFLESGEVRGIRDFLK